jgi:ornithine decarboxylase
MYCAPLYTTNSTLLQWTTLLPRIEPFYAFKCNPAPAVVSRLIALGTGADCASREEIDLALRAGLDPSSIIFANPCKLPAHLRHARDVGVLKLTADNEEELYKVRKIHPNAEVIIRIQVRHHIVTDHTA